MDAHSFTGPQSVWYCPSRWLLAHHDAQAGIQTLSSHMCLADLNNDGESLLALVDFKTQPLSRTDRFEQSTSERSKKQPGLNLIKPPFDCRLRVYRGQQLIYNHFLDDMPSCLLVTSITLPLRQKGLMNPKALAANSRLQQSLEQQTNQLQHQQQPLLTLAINDDVYFYHKLKASHRICLEDEDFILDSLNRSEVDAWRMVKQDKVDIETMRELLIGLSQEIGLHELTSHSRNFLALADNEARKQYLVAWKYKRLQNGFGEQLMSMDTICCAAARLKFDSNVTRSGDYGLTRPGDSSAYSGTRTSNLKSSKLADIQQDGLVVGTEDRHLLVYELRSIRTRLESHFRLASVPDHILVERRLPSSFADNNLDNLKSLTYKILVSCRNCRIYSIDMPYLNERKSVSESMVKELVVLKSNVLDMCWSAVGKSDTSQNSGTAQPAANSIVASCDKQVYCFSSETGECRWLIRLETPIKCLIGLPRVQISSSNETDLIGVGLHANRIDFYTSSSGRIVDSIYLSQDDHPQAMTFGRLGREDNCLCVVTRLGHLLMFILKRTAKFEHGQCLSSAASYASDTLERCQTQMMSLNKSPLFSETTSTITDPMSENQTKATKRPQQQLNLSQPPSLPSASALTKSSSLNLSERTIDSILHSDHDCNQIKTKATLDAHLAEPQVQIPLRGRDFVDQILEQSRNSRLISRVFARHLCELRDKVKSTIEQQPDMKSGLGDDSINRVSIVRVTGLGNIYQVVLLLRLNLGSKSKVSKTEDSLKTSAVTVFLTPKLDQDSARKAIIKPFRFELSDERKQNDFDGAPEKVFEKTIQFKLWTSEQSLEANANSSFDLEVSAVLRPAEKQLSSPMIFRPVLINSINIPTC